MVWLKKPLLFGIGFRIVVIWFDLGSFKLSFQDFGLHFVLIVAIMESPIPLSGFEPSVNMCKNSQVKLGWVTIFRFTFCPWG